ncbi:MAG: penicillin-binding transpeptidase domain-containing protein [Clostridium sp.]|nr:penicillin-binding transpeptidase domain-containing protein [Clostridium sp.]
MKNTDNGRHAPQKKKKNWEIMLVTWAFVLLFFGLSGYIVHYSATHRQELINNSYNGRQQILIAQNRRGRIFSAGGEVLAQTVTDEEGKEKREYPYQNLFAHAVGYATNGRMGIEALANYYLINSNAPLSEKAALDLQAEKYPGDDVYTTLNVDLQQVASTALGIYQGAVIVTEPGTGKVLAMVSKPDFNPEDISEMWDALMADKESSILLNRVTQGLYPPGSTFKIVTALEYIRENPDSYSNYSYNCTGALTRGEDRIQCYHGSVHGGVNFKRSFAKSCNTSFANIGLSLDKPAFHSTLEQLLFNQKLPVDFNCNVSRVDVSSKTQDSDMMQISIGQGTTSITPLLLNMITCSIANDGVLMEPYLVDYVQNSAGNRTKTYSPSAYGKLMDSEEAQILKELMTDVVEEGTASRLKGLSYTAAGKTGSAEYGTVKGDSHAWFTGFAPAENPEICVTIIIEGAGAGGDYAVPIAKRIFDAYFGV